MSILELVLIALAIAFSLTILLLPALYFGIGLFVRRCAERTETYTVKEDGGKDEIKTRPKPFLWHFVPERTTEYLQRRANVNVSTGVGSKATPATGSAIFDVIHNVPGKILVRPDITNPNSWYFRDCKPDERETHRRGLFYHLYGVHWIGFFAELREVKVNEVRVSIDEDELKKYRKDLEEWKKKGEDGERPHEPTYTDHVKSYTTYSVYYSREHAVVVRGAETAGAYTLDIYINIVYEENFPVKARTETSDPNATLTTNISQSVNTATGSHQPEYYLFENVVNEDVHGKTLKQRRDDLINDIVKDVKDIIHNVIGLTLKAVIIYSIDMDDKQRTLLELQEKTEREEQARIRQAEREIQVAEANAKRAVAEATGNARSRIVEAKGARRAQMLLNESQADHVVKVILPIAAGGEDAVRTREAEAYENNPVVHTSVRGSGSGILVGK